MVNNFKDNRDNKDNKENKDDKENKNNRNNKTENKKKKTNIIKGSGILSFLFFIADWLYKKIGVSASAFIFTGYEACGKYYEQSFFYRLFQGYEPNFIKNSIKKLKRFIILRCENSFTVNLIKSFADNILAANLTLIGMFFMSFGLYSAIMYFLKIYVFGKPETMLIDLIAGGILIVASILMCLKKQTLYDAVYSSIICNRLFFKFLGFPEKREKAFEDLIEKNMRASLKNKSIICFLAGMILGILTYFITTPVGAVLAVCGVIAGITVVYAILCYPEAGFLAILFIVPFLPPGNLIITGALPCILVTGCYFLKLIRGKRAFTFEILDLFVLIFCVLLFFSGLVSVSKTGSIRPAMMYLCFTIMYFTAVNIIRSKEMITRSVAVIIFSGFLVAAYGVYQNYFGVGNTTWQDMGMFEDISGRVVSTLENPNVLAEYLILIIPFIIVSLFILKTVKEKMPHVIYIMFTVICLIFTWSRGSWLGFIASCVILFAIIHRKTIIVYLAMIFAVPFAPVVLPETIIQRFISIGNIGDSSTSYRLSIWQATIKMISNHIFEGIGVGTEAFKLVYPEYALAGIEGAPHSHSLYLQVCVESGAAGIAALIFIIFFFIQYCFTGIKKAEEKYLKLLTAAGLCSVIGFLINGFTDYVWYNFRVYLMFWLVLAITAAICRFNIKNSKNSIKLEDITKYM